jgi:hypothetical protein
MRILIGLCAVTIVFTNPAFASEAGDSADWQIALNGGTTIYSGGDDPRFASIGLTREFDSGYIGLSASMVDSGMVPGVINAVPAKSETLTISAGKTIGDVGLDSYVSIGQRRFDAETFQRLGRRIVIDSDGKSFAAGTTLTWDLAVSDDMFVSPFAAVDYDRIDIGRAILLPNGDLQSVKSQEEGVTGTFGIGAQKMFGADAQHNFGVSAALVATSNSSAARSGSGSTLASRVVAGRNQPGKSDEWAEIGATVSVALAPKWRLNFAATRTLGFTGPEATSLSAGISFAF